MRKPALLNNDKKSQKKTRVYQRDIAELAGVSISTVSRVLGDVGGISESVKEQVYAAAAELGYEKSDDSDRTRLRNVTLLTNLPLAPSNDPFHADVLNTVELACSEAGVQLSLASFNNGPGSDEKVFSRIQQNPADGLLLLSMDDMRIVDQIREMNIPLVMINVDNPDAPEDTFLPDNYQGARLAMRHLLENGHERILHIAESRRLTIRRRTEAYHASLEEAGIRVDPKLIVETEINAEETYRVMKKRLKDSGPDFTAVFCANDISAMGFMRAAQELGLRIPQDISVVGFDDIASVAFLTPPLTTVRIEVGELASLALHRLIERVANPDLTPMRVSLACRLIKRQSVARLT